MKRNEFKKLAARVPKYRAVKTVIDGKTFDSKKEARRYRELKLLAAAGQIHGLRTQVSFTLEVGGTHICRYVADFVYFENGERKVEDCKGFLTKEYKLKKKLMKAVLGIEIVET